MISSIKERWLALPVRQKIGRYVSTALTTGSSLVAHTIGLIVLARALGVEQYGLFVLVTTGATLALVWCGLGCSETCRRLVARNREDYPKALGHALLSIFGTGVALTLIATPLIAFFVDISPGSAIENHLRIGAIVFSNVVLFTFAGVAEQILLAHDRTDDANVVNLLGGIGRVAVVAVACLLFGVTTVRDYALWHLGFYVILGGIAWWYIAPFGRPQWQFLRDEARRGLTINFASMFLVLRQNADVLVLASVVTPAEIALYSLARRIVGNASVVTATMDRLVYSNFARAGQLGVAHTVPLVLRYGSYALALCLGMAVVLISAAPLIPYIFGKGFADAALLTQLLSGTLILTSLQWLASDALNASEQHVARLVAETISGVLGLAATAALTFALGLGGAIIAVYVAGLLSAGALLAALFHLASRSPAEQAIT